MKTIKLLFVITFFQFSFINICAMDAGQENCALDFNDIESVKKVINEMFQIDQEMRTQFLQDRHNPEVIEKMTTMDYGHTVKMKEIIAIHGWPIISKFGAEGDAQAWLLVQHADRDLQFQEQCLGLLENLVATKEINPNNYAYLYDRVALAQGNKQKYGTQCFVSESSELFLRPHEGTMQDLDECRAQMGLMPIAAYLEQMKMVYEK
ncbi:MAG: hypothetical protein Q8Q60_04555 [Candidatus Chromulinivorax sp.]|nr:hypothetical protein [Candidatus Chromulinivorax sp.]